MVTSAQAVDRVRVPKVGCPPVVHRCPFELGQNAQRIYALHTALFLHVIVGECRRAGAMHPAQASIGAQATFIEWSPYLAGQPASTA